MASKSFTCLVAITTAALFARCRNADSGAAGIAAGIVGAFRRPRSQSSLSGSNVS